jgi:NTP pyrophosphatase (non-canonical NTP hydrolase)
VNAKIRHGAYPAATSLLLNEYERWVVGQMVVTPKTTVKGEETDNVLHAAIGLATEAPEILDLAKKELFGKLQAAPRDRWVDEIGDLIFYLVFLLNAKGITLQEAITANVDKLCERYSKPGFMVGDILIGTGDTICGVCGEGHD